MPVHAFLKGGHAVLMVQKHEKSPFLADVRQPPEGQPIVAWHEVPGKRPPKEPSRRVRYERAQRIPEVSLVETRRTTRIVAWNQMDRQESDRTLRDGSLGVAMSQALRARLRSHCPSGTKPLACRAVSAYGVLTLENPPSQHALQSVRKRGEITSVLSVMKLCLNRSLSVGTDNAKILRPFRAAALGWAFPGLKSWARLCSPFGG